LKYAINSAPDFATSSSSLSIISLDNPSSSPSFTVTDASVNLTLSFYFIPYFDGVLTTSPPQTVIFDASNQLTLKIGSGYTCTISDGLDASGVVQTIYYKPKGSVETTIDLTSLFSQIIP
jgi:hypothetical protein